MPFIYTHYTMHTHTRTLRYTILFNIIQNAGLKAEKIENSLKYMPINKNELNIIAFWADVRVAKTIFKTNK